MKKYVLNHKKMRIVTLACALISIPLTHVQLHAEQAPEYRGETALEHKILVEVVSSLAEYGKVFAAFTKYFFGVSDGCPELMGSAKLKPSKAVFNNITKKLLENITGIKTRCAKYQASMQTKENKHLLTQLESLATLLANSQTKLRNTLQKYLGTAHIIKGLTALANEEAKQVVAIDKLQKEIDLILLKHEEKQLKQQFDTFVKNTEYALSFPQNNRARALSAALKYKKLK